MFQNQQVLQVDEPIGPYVFINMDYPLKPQNCCVGLWISSHTYDILSLTCF